MHRRSRLKVAAWIGIPVLAGGLLVGALAALRLARIAADLRSVQQTLVQVRADVENGRLASAREGLDAASVSTIRANDALYGSIELQLIGWVPAVHQNLDALQRSVGVALTLVDGGRQILNAARTLEGPDGNLEVPLASGAIPLDAVLKSHVATANLAVSLPGRAERPGSNLLLGPIADLQRKVFDEANSRRDQLDAVSRALTLLEDMAGANGARRYLIAVANTAEMRGTGGMILSYGELLSQDGDFELGNFGNIDELFLDGPVPPDRIELPADYLNRWNVGTDGGLQVTRLWRNANMAPDFTFIAPVLEAMYTQKTGLRVDGVIQIDPVGLAAILKGTGPVSVPTVGVVTAANVVSLTLNQAYIRFPERDVRQEVLGDVAKEVFRVLVDGKYDSLRPLGEAIFDAAAERHIMFHSPSSRVESEVRFFGADGALPAPDAADYMHLTVQNMSFNKLDYYVDSTVTLTGSRPVGQPGEVTATIDLHNAAPPTGTNQYIFGPFDEEQIVGLYRGVVSLYVPSGTKLASGSADPGGAAPRIVTEAGRTAVTFNVNIFATASQSVVLHLVLPPRPPGDYRLVLVPSPRVRPTTFAVHLETGDAVLDRTIELTRTAAISAGGGGSG